MTGVMGPTLELYRDALRATGRSLVRGWIIALAVVVFAGLMLVAAAIAAPLGILGGFLLGAVNALLIGATLSLVQQAISSSRQLNLNDIKSSFGQYFWEVIMVGFVLWLPIMLIDQGAAANPYGPFLAAAIFLLLFILLNPAPEVIYQIRPGSPLDVIRLSYEFVVQNWIEWFLPLALVVDTQDLLRLARLRSHQLVVPAQLAVLKNLSLELRRGRLAFRFQANGFLFGFPCLLGQHRCLFLQKLISLLNGTQHRFLLGHVFPQPLVFFAHR